MDARKSMKEVAEAILLTHEMDFGGAASGAVLSCFGRRD
jgi:hypothetical protein